MAQSKYCSSYGHSGKVEVVAVVEVVVAVVLVVGAAVGDEEGKGGVVVVFWTPVLPHLTTSDMSDGSE